MNPKEKQRYERFVEEFKFEDLPPTRPFVLLSGTQGVGKTHLALTLSNHTDVFLLDTELRGNIVARKFPKVKYAQIKSYLQLLGIVDHIIKNYDKGFIVIDSASDIQQLAEVRYKQVAKVEKIWPQYIWAQIYDMCDEIIKKVRDSNFGLILTSRMKEEYINDKATGNLLPRVYNRLPYNVDIMLELYKEKDKRKLIVTKDGYYDKTGEIPYVDDLKTIIENIVGGK